MEPSAESRSAALGWSPLPARLPLTAGRLAAISEVWRAFWVSRALVWGVGVVDARTAFFPLYPLVVAAIAALTGSTLVAGIAVSVLCSLAALYLLHRFVALDHGIEVAKTTV